LLIFAACNLVFWIAVAIVVALLVSDEVDLGVETLLRERQATAAVVLEQVIVRTPVATPRAEPTLVSHNPKPAETKAVQSRTATASPLPPSPTPSPTLRIQPTQDLSPPSTPTPQPSPAVELPQPTETPVRSPLLMSDPGFGDLGQMSQEMNRSATGRAVQIRYIEETLNETIAALLQSKPDLPYDNVYVDLKRDQVVVTGDVTVLGFDVHTEVMGTVVARDCLPEMEIHSVSIAGVLTPGFVKDQVKKLLLEALDWYPADYPLCLDQIVLEEDRATVYGHRR
jgi:hypothetical protein